MEKFNQTKKERNNGITLIALVITIIVLLILAAVSIATLTGENGILTRAGDASNKSKEAEEKEQIGLAYTAAMAKTEENGVTEKDFKEELQKYDSEIKVEQDGENFKVIYPNGHEYTVESNGNIAEPQTGETPPSPTGDKPGKPDGNGIFTENSTINGQKTSSKDNPIIPEGFKPIDEGEAVWGDGTKLPAVDKGLVIEDINYNQFVWVSVDSSNFKRAEGYWNGKKDTKISDCSEPFAKGYATEEDEYNKMKSSVETNGGFYIGRFEAGKDSAGNVVVQKDVDVYNNIGWNASGNMNDETGGAVQESKKFKKRKGI